MIIQSPHNRELSLVEQKKMQWAKEREEMAKLNLGHSTYSQTTKKFEKTCVKTQFVSNLDLQSQNYRHATCNGFRELIPIKYNDIGHTNLPPIYRNVSEGDSSGYISDAGHMSNESMDDWRNKHYINPREFLRQDNYENLYKNGGNMNNNNNNNNEIFVNQINKIEINPNNVNGQHSNNNQSNEFIRGQGQQNLNNGNSERGSNYGSLMGGGVGGGVGGGGGDTDGVRNGIGMGAIKSSVGTPSSTPSSALSRDISLSSYSTTFQESGFHKIKEERAKWGNLYDPFNKESGRNSRSGPIWLEKGLNELRDSEEESIRSAFSYIRGQNVPIDPTVLAERESRRRKAMELQTAIKEQLLERENIRRREKEKRLFEERIEEERIMRQLEAERERLEYEQKMQKEKSDMERKKQEVMRIALEKAEQDAKLERERKKREMGIYSNHGANNLGMEIDLDETIRIEKIGGLTTDIHVDGCTSSANLNSEEPNRSSAEQDNVIEFDDESEKILIGTPIKLRQKTNDGFKNIKYKLKKMEKHPEEVLEDKSEDVRSNKSDHLSAASPAATPATATNTSTKAAANTNNNAMEQNNQDATDIDGIALVLQTISPIVPLPLMSQKDFFGLKNMNGNIQFATFMMTQQPQLQLPGIQTPTLAAASPTPTAPTSNSQAQTNLSTSLSLYPGQTMLNLNQNEIKFEETTPNKPSEERQCVLCKKNHYLRSKMAEDPMTANGPAEGEKNDEAIEQSAPVMESAKSIFRQQPIETLDVSTSTKDDELIKRILDLKILTPQKYRSIDSNLNLISTHEASTQTDSETNNEADGKSLLPSAQILDCDYCRHHYYHHHHLYIKEITESLTNLQAAGGSLNVTENGHTIVDIISNNEQDNDNDGSKQEETMMTTTTTTTTTIRSKSKEKKVNCNSQSNTQCFQNATPTSNLEQSQIKSSSSTSSNDRPKWGVNRPLMQYIKASDRDPFYVKNRKKKYIKRNNSDQKYDDCSSNSSLNNNSSNNSNSNKINCNISTPNSIDNKMKIHNNYCTDKMQKVQSERRNYCTEILPIKTDKNGKVYLIREASFILNEVYKKKNVGSLSNQAHNQHLPQQALNKRFKHRLNSDPIDMDAKDKFIDIVLPARNQKITIDNMLKMGDADNGGSGVPGHAPRDAFVERKNNSNKADVDIDI